MAECKIWHQSSASSSKLFSRWDSKMPIGMDKISPKVAQNASEASAQLFIRAGGWMYWLWICELLTFACEFLIQFEELGDAVGFGHCAPIEAVAFHYSFVVFLMGLAEFDRHCQFVIQVGKGAVWVFGTCIKYGLSCLLNLGFLGVGWGWPREVVVDDGIRITSTFAYPTQLCPAIKTYCVIRDYNFGQLLNRPQNATI